MLDILSGAVTKVNSTQVPDDDHRDSNDDHDQNSFSNMVDTSNVYIWLRQILKFLSCSNTSPS